ncbi:Uncharacterized conserved protein YndB, AHSA1/START domain [Agrococcus carbonis]|uniref:Uncharacterized conserved protein YndB, AHSA1/START domain n=2 Tax=Agrococcus carbonis TaxID=684552 RepID=A0A1H1MM95_9MICO|nr:Uncharacterized conserved protein YndB, AHSA1/START domain [Agrococcus carbonis]
MTESDAMGDNLESHTSSAPQPPLTGPIERIDDPRAPIEHSLDLPVSRTRAYDAYVLGLPEWWPRGLTASGSGFDRIDLDPHPGHRIVEHARDGSEIVWGEVLEAEPGARFSHTFGLSHDGDPSRVTIVFADLPHGGTRVLLQHHGWNESNLAGRAKHTDWSQLLERYAAYATHV